MTTDSDPPFIVTMWALCAIASLAEATHIGYKCGVEDCCGVARWRIHWPGREPAWNCDRHKVWAAHVAEAMGFELQVSPAQVRELDPPPPDHTAERFAAMDLD